MADLTDPGDERPEPPAKLPSQRRPSKPVQKIPDADRERVIDVLRQHAGVGDLTLDDFAERAGVVFAATTSMELEAVTADLPAIASPATATATTPMVGDTRRRKISRWAIGIMGGATRKGRWRVGDSFNVVGFYERGRFEARAAWNRRERFLQTAVGFGNEPTFVQDYEQLDARVSFALNERFAIFAEGVNLGNERQQRVGRYQSQILLLEETGPRYTIGMRAEF